MNCLIYGCETRISPETSLCEKHFKEALKEENIRDEIKDGKLSPEAQEVMIERAEQASDELKENGISPEEAREMSDEKLRETFKD